MKAGHVACVGRPQQCSPQCCHTALHECPHSSTSHTFPAHNRGCFRLWLLVLCQICCACVDVVVRGATHVAVLFVFIYFISTALMHVFVLSLLLQIDTVGEVVLEVGMSSGWGPSCLSAEQLAVVMTKLKQRAGTLSADVRVLRERCVDMAAAGNMGVATSV